MSSVKEKLYNLQRIHKEQIEERPDFNKVDIAGCLDGRWVENRFGNFVIREKKFHLLYEHGVSLKTLPAVAGETLSVLARSRRYSDLTPKDLLFIDTETTGLAGGSGTYAFLVGTGFLTAESFLIRQYFMPALEAERAMLNNLKTLLAGFKGFVSYNGKSYDIPLIRSRFVMNRVKEDFERFFHLDLLHSCRKLWKDVFPDKSLQGVEKNVLGFRRSGDIPGSDIPGRYFTFLSDHDPHAIKPIFQHNVMDILTMASLLIVFDGMVRSPEASTMTFNKSGLVRSYEQMGWDSRALVASQKLLKNADEAESFELLKKQAHLYKRKLNFDKAAVVWNRLLEKFSVFDSDIYVELAKYYEHRTKEYRKALAVIERMEKRICLARELKSVAMYSIELDEILYRKNRLIRKLEVFEK